MVLEFTRVSTQYNDNGNFYENSAIVGFKMLRCISATRYMSYQCVATYTGFFRH